MRSQVRIVRTHILRGDEAAADAAFDTLLTLFSDQPTLCKEVYKIANKFSEAKNNQKAHQLQRYLIYSWSFDEDIHSRKLVVVSHIVLGDDEEAQVKIDNLIADFNDHPDLPEVAFAIGEKYYNKGVEFENQKLAEQAKDNFIKAIGLWQRMTKEITYHF